jgi:two-component system, OmpR family, alkaline phosphatase synthesis response regulator PhoP
MKETVWVVDDEPLIRAAVLAVLAEVGYETRGFESAAELYVALVGGAWPDLVILDHMLPDEDGAQVVHSLRERSEYRDISILFLTAVSDEESERLTDLAPVVRKPFDFRDLITAVEQRLAERTDASEAELAADASPTA